ncbi:MAG: amidohydrolase family protein [Synergistaceae bacterium]|nr:amidohydrolase family protein [Synergistaceae bacterium]
MRTAVRSKRIYAEDGLKDGWLIYENGTITGIADKLDSCGQVLDHSDKRIIPGLFDTHNHGVFGYLLRCGQEGETTPTIRGFLKGTASFGISNIFPTCTYDMISSVRRMMDRENDGSKIVGIHVEGPWLNRVGERGIPVPWPEVSVKTAEKMVADGGSKLMLVAASPEIDGIVPVLEYFISNGVMLAFAHSDLKYKEASSAIEKYYSVATHLGNAMTGMHHRDIGALGACLLDDSMDYEVICDGVHICFEMLKIYFRVQDYSRFMVISDNSGMAGLPPGGYAGWQPDQIYIVEPDGRIHTETGRISGSSKSILQGVRNLVEVLGIPIETALRMASLQPCKKYGLDRTKGSLKAGKCADFVVIDDDYSVLETYSEGRKVYDSSVDIDLVNHEFVKTSKRQ